MTQLAFAMLATVGAAYMTCRRRRFDGFALAYASACVYFMPGFVGFVTYPGTAGLQRAALTIEAYGVYLLVLAALLSAAVVYDLMPGRNGPRPAFAVGPYVPLVATTIGVIGFMGSVATTGSTLLAADKSLILSELSRWHILWTMGALVGVVTSYTWSASRSGWISGLLLIADIFVGFRSASAIAAISLFTLHLHGRGRGRLLVDHWRVCVLGLALAAGLFVYKYLYILVKLGRFDLIAERVRDPEMYLLAFSNSEPFTTQSILNEVMRNDWSMGLGHFSSLGYKFVAFAPELGAEITAFGASAQAALFPFAIGGVGSNVWAEMWSSGGWEVLSLFVIVYVAVIVLLGQGLTWADRNVRAIAAIWLAYWAFYAHRNDLAYTLDLWRRALAVVVLAALVSWVLTQVANRSGAPQPQPRP